MSTDKTERAAFEAYPPLPEGWITTMTPDPEGTPFTWFDEDQMRAYVDADRKARAALPATVVQPVADDTKLTLLMAPYHLNLVVGHDRAQLLAFGRDVWAAAKRGDSPTVRTRSLAEASAAFDAGTEGKEVQHGTGPRSDGSSVSRAVSPEGRDSVTNAQVHPSAPAESGWQPIASAPKDEIVMLAAEFDRPGDWRMKCGYYQPEDGAWRVWGASWQPTMWQPMPAAPSAAQPGGADGGA